MKLSVEIPEYLEGEGLASSWEPGFKISVRCDNNVVQISANKAGLISLARNLLTLAQDGYGAGHHWHFDEINSLEDGSSELIIDKSDDDH